MKSGFAAVAAGVAFSFIAVVPANAQLTELRIRDANFNDVLQGSRDRLQALLGISMPTASPMATRSRFTAEGSSYDNDNPFAMYDAADPFAALAYAKAVKAPPPPSAPVWLYGVNGILSYDRTTSIGSLANTTSGMIAVDVTKVGIFTASDALTFLATGADSWSSIPTAFFNSTSPSGSGTLAYTNGGFSADLTATASWTTNRSTLFGIAAPANSSLLSYTANAQYKFDIGHSWYVEPTAGVQYMDFYTANFGASTGSATEIHGGGRIGTEIAVGPYKLQPSLTGAAFQIVSVSGAGGVAAAGAGNVAGQLNQLGGRGAAKLNVLWTSAFSSFVEARLQSVAGIHTAGVSGGLRYNF